MPRQILQFGISERERERVNNAREVFDFFRLIGGFNQFKLKSAIF